MAERKRRADAQQNRALLLDAARASFAEHGSTVALEAVARRAGVGIGTLYRHFPTREALVEGVYREEIRRLCDDATRLLAENEPAAALRAWMNGFAEFAAVKWEIADALRAVASYGAESISQTREELVAAIRPLLDAGVADGTFRADVHVEDVLTSLIGIFLATGPKGHDQAGRLIDLLMNGLRPE